jgi:sodium/bile acid cotransporter 7
MPDTPHQAPVAIPQSADEIAAVATALGLVITAECAPGVAANLALLARHARTLRGDPA